MMLSASKVQQHLRDWLFHGLHKQLCNSMHYLYDDMRIRYPQLVTAAWKAKSEQGDQPWESIWVRSTQAEGWDDIVRLSKKIVQLQVVVQKPQKNTISNPQQSGSERDDNGNQHNARGQGKNWANSEKCNH